MLRQATANYSLVSRTFASRHIWEIASVAPFFAKKIGPSGKTRSERAMGRAAKRDVRDCSNARD
jgi:hypothetical protein